MGDSEQDIFPAHHRAQRRRRRRARTRIVAAVAIGVLAVAGALLVTGALPLPRSEDAKAASSVEPTAPRQSFTTSPDDAPEPRALTPDAPLKLWIGGDSLAGSLGPSLGEMTAATGVVAPQYDSRVSSGLLSPSFFDWEEHGTEQMAELEPEAVVFVIGTNDANIYDETDALEYEQRTDQMMQILRSSDRPVYWVNAPVMRDDDLEEGVQAVNEIQRRVAARYGDVTYVDAHDLFDDEDGDYTSRLPDETGEEVSMRAGDGIHFSADGADHLARFVFSLLDDDWHISTQADPTRPQEVVETEGSTQVSGTYRSTGSSDGGATEATRPSSATTTTTAPSATTTTAPSATTTTAPSATTTTTGPPPGP